MRFGKKETKKTPEVIITVAKDKPADKSVPVCKSPCCNQYPIKDGLCQHCFNDLNTIGYK